MGKERRKERGVEGRKMEDKKGRGNLEKDERGLKVIRGWRVGWSTITCSYTYIISVVL